MENKKLEFNTLYGSCWHEFLYSVCLKYTCDIEEAKDWCQMGFVKAYGNLDKWANTGSMKAWICKVIRNTIIDDLRKRKDVYNMEYEQWEKIAAEEEDDDDLLDHPESLHQIQLASEQLSPGYKRVFQKYYVEGLSHAEIASDCGIGIGTSKSNLSKAKERVRKLLETAS